MIRIEGTRITIGDDLHASNYRPGHSDFDVILQSGESVHIPFRALRFALAVIARTHECGGFEDLWRVIGGEGEFTWSERLADTESEEARIRREIEEIEEEVAAF